MKIFVTGGAGYIGSHLVKNLLKEKFEVVAFDNLSTGFIEPLEIIRKEFASPTGGLEFIRGDLANVGLLEKIFQQKKIDVVIHLAAKTDAAESVRKAEVYHQENYINSINLIEAMTNAGVDQFIFSSTAAVYGNPQSTPIDESHPTKPENPYGQTKLDFEKYLARSENLKYLIFRYFNVGGSDSAGLVGRSHFASQDLMENIFKVALGQKQILKIFGDNYDTPDGTPIRDFIHVEDVSAAHILALKKIANPPAGESPVGAGSKIFNLGSEQGFSVKEIIDKASLIIGREIPTETAQRREGDITVSVASAQKAKEILGWNPQYSNLDSIIRSDWNWRKIHPKGYTN